jgi:hypothetical protein
MSIVFAYLVLLTLSALPLLWVVRFLDGVGHCIRKVMLSLTVGRELNLHIVLTWESCLISYGYILMHAHE